MFSNRIYQQIWVRIGTRSRRALRKTHKKWGHLYEYKPRGDLLYNLSYELNISIEQVENSLQAMRRELLNQNSNRL